MARERSPARVEAEKLYLDSKGTMKLVDIAAQLGLTDVKVRKWKNLDKWDEELKGNVPLKEDKKKVERTIKKSITKNNKVNIKEPIADEVKEVMENGELTDKQRLFCVIYSRCLNATKAYQKVYKCTYETAMICGNRLLRNVKVKEQLDKLIETECNKEFLKRSLIQKYKDIAFADINEYVTYGTEYIPEYDKDGKVKYDDEGQVITKPRSYIILGDSERTDGTLISEISTGRDGVKIKLADKLKAMDALSKISNLLNDEERRQLELEYRKLQNEKIKSEIAKNNGSDDSNIPDDGFIEALEGSAVEDWADEQDN